MPSERSGAVTMINALGTGILETRALLAFLPRISEHLLGEPLKLPNVATWWCGQEEPRSTVLERLDQLVVKHAFHKGSPVLFGRGIEARSREALAASIAADPGA